MDRIFFKQIIGGITLAAFVSASFAPAYAQGVHDLSAPGIMVPLSQPFNPPVLKGIKVYRDDPFRFNFILDRGDARSGDSFQVESTRLIKYFLTSLTVPEKDLWVNLSPYEKDRIVPEAFGRTEMGRDLLAQDYLLKQITSSVTYPEGESGKKFWAKVYKAAFEKYGTTDVPVDMFNKVWIIPDRAVVYENAGAGTAYVVESRLKVMLDTDYKALESNAAGEGGPRALEQPAASQDGITAAVLREIIVPILEKEVNEGKGFVQLRQVYQSVILAAWFKKKMSRSLLSRGYVDQNKILGVHVNDPKEAEQIWQRYVEAFKKGAYNYIKEEQDVLNAETIPRRYFSGGCSLALNQAMSVVSTRDGVMTLNKGQMLDVAAVLVFSQPSKLLPGKGAGSGAPGMPGFDLRTNAAMVTGKKLAVLSGIVTGLAVAGRIWLTVPEYAATLPADMPVTAENISHAKHQLAEAAGQILSSGKDQDSAWFKFRNYPALVIRSLFSEEAPLDYGFMVAEDALNVTYLRLYAAEALEAAGVKLQTYGQIQACGIVERKDNKEGLAITVVQEQGAVRFYGIPLPRNRSRTMSSVHPSYFGESPSSTARPFLLDPEIDRVNHLFRVSSTVEGIQFTGSFYQDTQGVITAEPIIIFKGVDGFGYVTSEQGNRRDEGLDKELTLVIRSMDKLPGTTFTFEPTVKPAPIGTMAAKLDPDFIRRMLFANGRTVPADDDLRALSSDAREAVKEGRIKTVDDFHSYILERSVPFRSFLQSPPGSSSIDYYFVSHYPEEQLRFADYLAKVRLENSQVILLYESAPDLGILDEINPALLTSPDLVTDLVQKRTDDRTGSSDAKFTVVSGLPTALHEARYLLHNPYAAEVAGQALNTYTSHPGIMAVNEMAPAHSAVWAKRAFQASERASEALEKRDDEAYFTAHLDSIKYMKISNEIRDEALARQSSFLMRAYPGAKIVVYRGYQHERGLLSAMDETEKATGFKRGNIERPVESSNWDLPLVVKALNAPHELTSDERDELLHLFKRESAVIRLHHFFRDYTLPTVQTRREGFGPKVGSILKSLSDVQVSALVSMPSNQIRDWLVNAVKDLPEEMFGAEKLKSSERARVTTGFKPSTPAAGAIIALVESRERSETFIRSRLKDSPFEAAIFDKAYERAVDAARSYWLAEEFLSAERFEDWFFSVYQAWDKANSGRERHSQEAWDRYEKEVVEAFHAATFPEHYAAVMKSAMLLLPQTRDPQLKEQLARIILRTQLVSMFVKIRDQMNGAIEKQDVPMIMALAKEIVGLRGGLGFEVTDLHYEYERLKEKGLAEVDKIHAGSKNGVKLKGAGDPASSGTGQFGDPAAPFDYTGGIDLNSRDMDLETRGSSGEEILFDLDPAMFQQLQNSPGFTPRIISIQQIQDLDLFLR